MIVTGPELAGQSEIKAESPILKFEGILSIHADVGLNLIRVSLSQGYSFNTTVYSHVVSGELSRVCSSNWSDCHEQA